MEIKRSILKEIINLNKLKSDKTYNFFFTEI